MKGGPKPQTTASELPPLRSRTGHGRFLEFCETHLRHQTGALAGKPFHLAPWQRTEIIRPLFGELHRGRRRFRTCFVSLPRRNGKSSLAAAIGLYALFADDEPGAFVVSAAANRDQARVVFGAARQMVENSPALSAMSLVYRSEIVIPSTGSRYRVLSRDSKVQHGLDVHCAVIDELHAHRDAELYRVLTSSTGSRRQPLTFVITTASSDPHSIASEVHDYALKVRDGILDDPSFMSVIYSAPEDADPWSESTWRACNPALRSGFRSLDEMRTAALQAQAIPAREASFRQLYLNQFGSIGADSWLPLAAWDACAGAPPDRAALRGRRCYLGVDLSSTRDLSALVAIFPDDDGGYDVLADFWLPQETVGSSAGRDRVPYPLWSKQGFLTLTPGNIIDHQSIAQRIREYSALCDVEDVAFDRWSADQMMADLQRDGIPAFPVPQTIAGLASGTKELERLVLTGKLRHGAHPVLRWCASNVVVERDHADNLKPSKRRSAARIDGISALVNGLTRALQTEGGVAYADRDPLYVAI